MFKNIKNILSFQNIFLFYKILKNSFQKLFLKTIFQTCFKKQLPNKPIKLFAISTLWMKNRGEQRKKPHTMCLALEKNE